MSIYIHIPFCNTICTYCDFCKIYYNKKYIGKYLDSLEKEIKDRYKGELVKTIYIGGGTPTSLDEEELEKLFKIISIFNRDNNIEFTIEGNVESITEDKLKIMKKYGVNRVSIGVQSFDDKIIKILGRTHSKMEVFDKIKLIKKYINNINIDLIYAVTSDIDIVKRDINYFLELDIPHISLYSLILEDNTILKINKYKKIEEDTDYEMYKYIENTLESNGYMHYEVSNYARKGYESKHNLVYWNNNYYYGFGLSSTSYLNNERIVNTKNLSKYLNGNYIDSIDYEDKSIRMENEVMLGLRKLSGINLNEFKKRYNISLFDVYDIDNLIKEGYLEIDDYYLKINKDYIYTMNEILYRIFN